MADAPNVATYNKTGSITIDSDNYTKGTVQFALVPTTPKTKITDIGGGQQSVHGEPDWVAQIGFTQDWASAGSLSKKSIEWAGTVKTIVFTPQTGAETVTVQVRFEPSQVGGTSAAVNQATLNLDVEGQPVFGGGD